MILTFVAIAGVSYLIGSLPTAYLLVRWKTKQDVRAMGTGNVGALNSYEVTRSKLVGLGVLLIDLAKGVLAVALARLQFGDSLSVLACTAFFVVLGHNYPIWLSFKGGRGLASAAGAMLMINWFFVAVWGFCWSLSFLFTRDVHKGNILAIVATPFIALILSGSMVDWGILRAEDTGLFIITGFVMSALLFLRHLQPLKEILSKRNG